PAGPPSDWGGRRRRLLAAARLRIAQALGELIRHGVTLAAGWPLPAQLLALAFEPLPALAFEPLATTVVASPFSEAPSSSAALALPSCFFTAGMSLVWPVG